MSADKISNRTNSTSNLLFLGNLRVSLANPKSVNSDADYLTVFGSRVVVSLSMSPRVRGSNAFSIIGAMTMALWV